MAKKVFLFLCLLLLFFQAFGNENFETITSDNDHAKNPNWWWFWHPYPWLRPIRPGVHPPLPSGWHWPRPGVHPPLPSGWHWPRPGVHPPFLGGWHWPHPPLPSGWHWPHPQIHPPFRGGWYWPHPQIHPPFRGGWNWPHPPLPSWLPKIKWPFPHPPLPKTGCHFPLPPFPPGGWKWPWLPHHGSKSVEDNKTLESKCSSAPPIVENCMKEGTYSFSDSNGYTFSAQCCRSIAEINDECSDELYIPVIKHQCSVRA